VIHHPAAGALEEQWRPPGARTPAERELWAHAVGCTRSLKRALVQLALDVLTDAPDDRRRESSRSVVRSARALDALAGDLRSAGLPLAGELGAGLEQLCRAAAAAGSGRAAPAGSLSALRSAYRAVRAALRPCLPTEMVAEGLPVAIGGRA
jgi:hypothetical protein